MPLLPAWIWLLVPGGVMVFALAVFLAYRDRQKGLRAVETWQKQLEDSESIQGRHLDLLAREEALVGRIEKLLDRYEKPLGTFQEPKHKSGFREASAEGEITE